MGPPRRFVVGRGSPAICRSAVPATSGIHSSEILHQYQITGELIELRVENPATVRRNGQLCFPRFDSCVFRKLPEECYLACSEIVKLEGGAGRVTQFEEADA